MNNQDGLSLPTILGIVFIVLKLCGVIDWSWLWVLSPFWIPAAIVIVVGLALYIAAKCAEGWGDK